MKRNTYLLVVDDSVPLSLDAYPKGRLTNIAKLQEQEMTPVLDELGLRIALDGLLQLRSVKEGVIRGLPPG